MRTTLISLCLLISMMVTADPVTKESAKERAVAFLTSKASGVAAARGEGGVRQQQNRQQQLRLQEQLSSKQHYVFNIGEREGYIILSADDCTGDLVLGYADEGSLDPDNMPENMRAWLQGYDDQIAWMKQHGISQEPAAARGEGTMTIRTPIAPMLTTMWNQDSPYNDRCPYVLADPNDGSTITRAAAGCLATAGAQVMYWHQKKYGQQTGRWTTTTQPIPSYEQTQQPYPIVTSWTDAQHYTTTMTVEAKAPTTIDWSKLADSYPASDEANAEVAKLIEYIGAGLQMNYGPMSAAAYSLFPPMLINYFGYNHSAQFVERRYYSYSEWTALMYDQLKNVGPVFFGGQSTGGGHAFVLDGYDEEDYFHVNWGWGGKSNGYFKLSVLYSDKQGIGGSSSSDGYNYFQNATINVNPDNSTGDIDSTIRLTVSKVWADVTTFERASAQDVFDLSKNSPLHIEYYNQTSEEYTFDIALVVLKDDTPLGMIELGKNEKYGVNTGYNDRYISIQLNGNIPDGTYRMMPICRKSGGGNWYDMFNANQYYFLLTISGNKLTVEPMGIVNLKAKLAASEQPKVGKPLTITATVTNNGPFYSGDLLLVHKATQAAKILMAQQIEIAKGQTTQYDFTFTPSQDGEMKLMLATDEDSITTITINIAPSTTTTGMLSMKKEDITLNEGDFDKGIYSNTISGTIKITNSGTNDHTSGTCIILCKVVNMEEHIGEEAGKITSDIVIPKGSTKEIPFEFDGLLPGEHYFFYVGYGETMAKINSSDIFVVNPGIDSYTADGTLTSEAPKAVVEVPQSTVALDLTQVSGVTTVVPNSNLNALYYVGSEVPAGLENKHIVKDGTLSSLVLSEGYDFFAPMGFTVTEAPAYARLFAPTGWSAITLPFDVTKVEIDGKTIDCTHLDSETNKSMLLMTFADEAEGIVRFEPAESFDANTPYLITFPGQTAAKIATFYGAENAYIEATTHNNFSGYLYKFAGTLSRLEPGEHYMLNNDGNAFELKPTWRVSSFRSYFKPLKEQHAQTLTIVTDETTGISETRSVKSPASTALFNLQGLRIAQPKRGLYIKNGKKVVVGR